MGIIVALIIVTILTLIWYYYIKNYNARTTKLVNQFPGPNCYPIVGTTLPILLMKKHEIFSYVRSLPKNFGPIFRTWNGNIPIITISDPQYAEMILNNSVHINKGAIYRYLLPWLGDGLLTSTGAKWHRHRKLLTPAFHFKILETFMDVFVERSKLLVDILSKKADQKKSFNIFPYITRCTLDIITETAMGIQVNAMSKETNIYVDAIYGIAAQIVERMNRGWLRSDFIFYRTKYGRKFLEHLSTLHNTTNKVVFERKNAFNQITENLQTSEDNFGRKKRDMFLDILLKTSKDNTALTHKQIREEVDTFMFEGHDTTTASISWTLFLLGLHLDIQEKTYKEISEILKDNGELDFSDLNELKYLERVLKESLRLYPSVPSISRRISDDIKIENYTIPAGTTVSIAIFDIHRNEKHFPDSSKFDPDRFLAENCSSRHPYAYIPFSAGPRNCIGQKFALSEEKVVLSYIIKNFKIKSLQTVDNIYPVTELILRPHEGMYVTLEKRT